MKTYKKWSGLKGAAARAIALVCAGSALAFAAGAQASIAWGSINNFDTVNDTGAECHGFEIEIEGIHSRDITYTYDWNHYGTPRITEDSSDPARPRVFVRYAAQRRPDGTWSAYTAVPSGPIGPTDGHRFTDPSVNFGGEHFGVGFYNAPTAIRYSWLKDDGAGNLVFAGPVNIGTPTFNYFPPPAPQEPAKVVAVIVPPPPPEDPEAPEFKFGPAMWVKEIKTTSHNNGRVELRDLVSDDPEDENDRNWRNGEPDEVEVEWRLLQTEFEKADGGKNGQLEGGPEELPEGDEVVTRRYEFFKYAGPVDGESGEAVADEVGVDGHGPAKTVIYNHHFDPLTREWVKEEVDLQTIVVVGDYIGAQMAGFDPGARIGLIDHLQDGEINVPYVERSMVIGGTPPIRTTRTGELPDGMGFDEVSGVLSGTPLVSGVFAFQIHSTDDAGGDVTASYQLTIAEAPRVTIQAVASPAAGGTVDGAGEHLVGELVTLQATAAPEHIFVNWTEGGAPISPLAQIQFVAETDRTLTANFARKTYAITVSHTPAGSGVATGGGSYESGANVTVTAAPNAGYVFRNWTEGGALASSSASYSFTANVARALVANFAKRGDVNGDQSVTSADLALILAARNQPASGPNDPRDLDQDGKITALDARIAVLLIKQAGP